MVSGFVCPCHGFMRLTDAQKAAHPDIVHSESLVFLEVGGKRTDGTPSYWTNADVVKQFTERVQPIFDVLHPGCRGLFLFDNSSNHHMTRADALNAYIMAIKNGGKKVSLGRKNGYYTGENGAKVVQQMDIVGPDGVLVTKGLETMHSYGARLVEQETFRR